MKKIKVVLKGTGEGLLMHSTKSMEDEGIKSRAPKKYDSKEEAEKVAYRNEKNELFIPARCLKASMLNASTWYKVKGRQSLKPYLAAGARIEPSEVILRDVKTNKPLKTYVIDRRPVNIQKQRIIRSRPLIKDWKVEFEITYNPELLPDPMSTINLPLVEAGERVGVLDNRPHKSFGENGTFVVEKFLPGK